MAVNVLINAPKYEMRLKSVAALSSLIYYSLRDHSTRFGRSLHPSSAVHKTVDATTGTSHVSV